MTDKQLMALMREFFKAENGILKVSIDQFKNSELRLLIVDAGGNYHSIGIMPNGVERTYE